MERVILHCDLNNFYASVECLYNPQLRGLPLAVGGDVDKRHGIILAKNELAKKFGVKTAETIFEAKRKCPNLVIVSPHFSRYLKFSKKVKAILSEYSDLVESFGIDEAWLDVTHSQKLFGGGEDIAYIIKTRIKKELGITASVGVSYNKIFAKLASDLEKPDAVTIINKDNLEEKVYTLPASYLLMVGRATTEKLKLLNINTIGDIARADPNLLKSNLGKNGVLLREYALGNDFSPVKPYNYTTLFKSVSNSTTLPYNLTEAIDVKVVIYIIAESIADKLKKFSLEAKTITLMIKDSNLDSRSKHYSIDIPTNISSEIAKVAYQLFIDYFDFSVPVRSVGVAVYNLIPVKDFNQLSLFVDHKKREVDFKLDCTMEAIRSRFGQKIINRGLVLTNDKLKDFTPKLDNIIFPEGFFK